MEKSSTSVRVLRSARVQNGNTVVLSDQVVRPVSSVDVYVLRVERVLENVAGLNIRKFTLTLQEA